MGKDNQYRAIRRVIDDSRPLMNRAIVIGAGDAGIRSVIAAKNILEKKIHPAAWKYVRWIAVNSYDIESLPCAAMYRFSPDQFSREENNILYLPVPVTAGMSAEFLSEKYNSGQYYDCLPDPDVYNLTDADDPVRALGRFSFFLNEDNIRRILIKERDRLDQLSDDQCFSRMVAHGEGAGKKKSRVSVFIIVSPSCGTGGGMFFDIAAMVRDIFRNSWPGPDIYAVLAFTQNHEREEIISRAETYAFMKELDYFMSGGRFVSVYPSGRKVEVQDSLFDIGKVYVLGRENMAGNILDDDRDISELAGRLVSAFISHSSGGEVDIPALYDSSGIAIYQPVGGSSIRKACYSSFGISRAFYPVPELVEAGHRSVAVRMIEAFFRPVDAGHLARTLGTPDSGLARSLNLGCRLIFDRMHPARKSDIENETVYIMNRFVHPGRSRDRDLIIPAMKDIAWMYSPAVLAARNHLLVSAMERRYRPELERIRSVIAGEFEKYITDPEKRLLFAEMTADILCERLDLYIKKYREGLNFVEHYSVSDMESLIREQSELELCDDGIIDAFIQMASFNYSQSVYESMLISAGSFALEFRAAVSDLKNSIIVSFHKRISSVKKMLLREIAYIKSGFDVESNPFTRVLLNHGQADSFIEKYFFSGISATDLITGADLKNLTPGSNEAGSIVETFLVSRRGVHVLNMTGKEITDIITAEYGDLSDKDPGELISILYGDDTGCDGSPCKENAFYKYELDKLKAELFRIIHSSLNLAALTSLTLRDLLDERRLTIDRLLEQLDVSSRPYIKRDSTLPGYVEYYRAVAGFRLDTDDDADETAVGAVSDLPPRIKNAGKRENAEPPVAAEVCEIPSLCGNFEVTSMSLLTGLTVSGILPVREWAEIYHAAVSARKRPLHVFNSRVLNALYFPDPAAGLNYPDPAKLWSGLVLLNILEEKNGSYCYTESLAPVLRELEARENYRRVILELYAKFEQYRDSDDIPPELLAEVVSGLGILAKNPSDGRLQFRRDYLPVIADIISDGDTSRAGILNEENMSIPKFGSSLELIAFFRENASIREFITATVRSVIERSLGHITAGADISLPARKIEQTVLPVFKNKFEFFNYYEKRGSLEWQNVLMKALSRKLDEYLSSSKFRAIDGSGAPDRAKIGELLKALEQRIPEAVLMEAGFRNRA